MDPSPGDPVLGAPLSEDGRRSPDQSAKAAPAPNGGTAYPAAGVALLAPYERTRPGYELGVSAASLGLSEHFPDAGGGFYEVNLWALWKRADQAALDPEKQAVDRMQLALGPLSDGDRYVRLQIACLARCFWTFPATVDLILDGIAAGQPNLSAGISCEPPWTGLRVILLRRNAPANAAPPEMAALHHQQGLDPRRDPRQQRLRAYLQILTWWMAGGRLDLLTTELAAAAPADSPAAADFPAADLPLADLAAQIYQRLGGPDRRKLLLTQLLTWHISAWAIPRPAVLPGTPLDPQLLGVWSPLESAIARELGEDGAAAARRIARNHDQGSCHHAFLRHLDHIIAEIGAGCPVALPGAGEERRRVLGAVTGYAHSIGSWLAGRSLPEAAALFPPAEPICARVYAALQAPTPRKRWLAACLWKKLGDDRAFAGRGLLDEDPVRFALPTSAFSAGA